MKSANLFLECLLRQVVLFLLLFHLHFLHLELIGEQQLAEGDGNFEEGRHVVEGRQQQSAGSKAIPFLSLFLQARGRVGLADFPTRCAPCGEVKHERLAEICLWELFQELESLPLLILNNGEIA